MDTLKREWNEKLTLRDVCVVIRCLLVEPNPTSSLNEEAGRMMAEDWSAWERRARLWTKVHAGIPGEMEDIVREVRKRDAGEDEEDKEGVKEKQKEIKGERRIKKSKDEKVAESAGVKESSTTQSTNSDATAAVPKKAAPAVSTVGRKHKSSSTTQKHSNATLEPLASPSKKPETGDKLEKDRSEKDKDAEKETDKAQTQSQDENEEVENSYGKENAITTTTSFTALATPTLPSSRSASPVKQLPAPTVPTESVPTTAAASPTATTTAPPPPPPPCPSNPRPGSLLGKKRRSEESLTHENVKAVKTTSSSSGTATAGKSSVTGSSSVSSSTKSKGVATKAAAAGMGPGTKITMKKKVGAGAAAGAGGKAKEARKGLKRF